jgi:hypothetical protein
MSRKPAHIEGAVVGGKLPGRRGVWTAVRELTLFTVSELCARVPHIHPDEVQTYLKTLTKGGYVSAVATAKGPRGGKENRYALVRDVGADAPRLRRDGTELPPTRRQQMWLAMKILGSFDVEQLAAAASTADVPVALSTVKNYARHLAFAGYLAGPPGGPYRLVNNTGGHAPIVTRADVVFDPNLNRVMWHEVIEP